MIAAAKMENFPRGVHSANTWGAPPIPLGTPSMSNAGSWSIASGEEIHHLRARVQTY